MYKEKITVCPADFCIDDNCIWYVLEYHCLLIKYDYVKQKQVYCKVIPAGEGICGMLFSSIYYYEKKVFLVPYNEYRVFVYDEEKDVFLQKKIINLSKDKRKLAFSGIHRIGDFLYCIPATYENILCINLKTLKLDYVTCLKDKRDLNYSFINSSCVIDKRLYFVSPTSNHVYYFDTECNNLGCEVIGGCENSYNSVASIGDFLYLLDKKNRMIVIYSVKENRMIQNTEIPIKDSNVRMTSFNKELVIIDALDSSEYALLNSKLKVVYHRNEDIKNKIQCKYKRGIVREYNGAVYYFDKSKICICSWNGIEMQDGFELYVDECMQQEIASDLLVQNGGIARESIVLSLDCFLQNVESNISDNKVSNRSIGYDIWELQKKV